MSTEKKDSQHKPAKKGGSSTVFSVGVDADAHRIVAAQAKKLKMSQTKYASAAIAYFAGSGLDPTKGRPQELANLSSKMSQEMMNLWMQNIENSDGIVSVIRGWERTLYGFMQQQQMSLNTYLERIESNVLRHQVLVESNLLAPMVEQIVTTRIESNLNRTILERLYTELGKNKSISFEEAHQRHTEERDKHLVNELRELLEKHPVPAPQPTTKPAITPVPTKPVVAAPASPPVSPSPPTS